MRMFKALTLAGVIWLAAGSTAFAEVQLTIRNGRVSLVAKDATVRQILTEWARVGQTKIVNVERISGGPVTLELKNVWEQQALDVLLRSVSGYMVAPRAVVIANASTFDRIVVMPTSVAPRAPVAAAPAPVFRPPGIQGLFGQPVGQPEEDDSDDQPPTPNVVAPTRGPVFNTFPQPQVINPQQQGAPTATPGVISTQPQVVSPQDGAPTVNPPQPAAYQSTPGAQPTTPGGAAVPGMIVQPPPQPGQTQPGNNP